MNQKHRLIMVLAVLPVGLAALPISIANSNFSTPTVGAGNMSANASIPVSPLTSDWHFWWAAGVLDTSGTVATNAMQAPHLGAVGTQAAYIQGNHLLSQDLVFAQGGMVTFSFVLGQRAGAIGNQPINVWSTGLHSTTI